MTTPPPKPPATEQPDEELLRVADRDRLPVRDVWVNGKLVEMPIDPQAPPAAT